MPRVSVLIPTYNRAALVERAIDSVLAQTFTDCELVVCDNASTDETWARLEMRAQSDPRLRIFRNAENLGPVRNWRRCADEARGQLAALLFSDDAYAPGFLAATVPWLEDDKVGFVFTQALAKGSGREAVLYARLPSGLTPAEAYLRAALCTLGHTGLPLSPAAAVFRLHDLRAALATPWPDPLQLGHEGHGAGPDLWTYLETARKYPYVAHVAEPLVHFFSHDGNLSLRPQVALAYTAAMDRFVESAGGVPPREYATAQFYRLFRTRLSSGASWALLAKLSAMPSLPALGAHVGKIAIQRLRAVARGAASR